MRQNSLFALEEEGNYLGVAPLLGDYSLDFEAPQILYYSVRGLLRLDSWALALVS